MASPQKVDSSMNLEQNHEGTTLEGDKVDLQTRRLQCMRVAVHQCPQLGVVPKMHLCQKGEVYFGNSKRVTRQECKPAQKHPRRQLLLAQFFP